jgi:hypothetical protein
MKNKFHIKAHEDYHEIKDSKKFKSLRLGCFPLKDGCHSNYFGLYYEIQLPTFDEIKRSLFKKIDFSENFTHGFSGENISITKEEVECEVRDVLKNAS